MLQKFDLFQVDPKTVVLQKIIVAFKSRHRQTHRLTPKCGESDERIFSIFSVSQA